MTVIILTVLGLIFSITKCNAEEWAKLSFDKRRLESRYSTQTDFDCKNQQDGYYYDVEQQCIAFHYCTQGQIFSYKCEEGKQFDEVTNTCQSLARNRCKSRKSIKQYESQGFNEEKQHSEISLRSKDDIADTNFVDDLMPLSAFAMLMQNASSQQNDNLPINEARESQNHERFYRQSFYRPHFNYPSFGYQSHSLPYRIPSRVDHLSSGFENDVYNFNSQRVPFVNVGGNYARFNFKNKDIKYITSTQPNTAPFYYTPINQRTRSRSISNYPLRNDDQHSSHYLTNQHESKNFGVSFIKPRLKSLVSHNTAVPLRNERYSDDHRTKQKPPSIFGTKYSKHTSSKTDGHYGIDSKSHLNEKSNHPSSYSIHDDETYADLPKSNYQYYEQYTRKPFQFFSDDTSYISKNFTKSSFGYLNSNHNNNRQRTKHGQYQSIPLSASLPDNLSFNKIQKEKILSQNNIYDTYDVFPSEEKQKNFLDTHSKNQGITINIDAPKTNTNKQNKHRKISDKSRNIRTQEQKFEKNGSPPRNLSERNKARKQQHSNTPFKLNARRRNKNIEVLRKTPKLPEAINSDKYNLKVKEAKKHPQHFIGKVNENIMSKKHDTLNEKKIIKTNIADTNNNNKEDDNSNNKKSNYQVHSEEYLPQSKIFSKSLTERLSRLGTRRLRARGKNEAVTYEQRNIVSTTEKSLGRNEPLKRFTPTENQLKLRGNQIGDKGNASRLSPKTLPHVKTSSILNDEKSEEKLMKVRDNKRRISTKSKPKKLVNKRVRAKFKNFIARRRKYLKNNRLKISKNRVDNISKNDSILPSNKSDSLFTIQNDSSASDSQLRSNILVGHKIKQKPYREIMRKSVPLVREEKTILLSEEDKIFSPEIKRPFEGIVTDKDFPNIKPLRYFLEPKPLSNKRENEQDTIKSKITNSEFSGSTRFPLQKTKQVNTLIRPTNFKQIVKMHPKNENIKAKENLASESSENTSVVNKSKEDAYPLFNNPDQTDDNRIEPKDSSIDSFKLATDDPILPIEKLLKFS